ncbi:hypothetical protein NDU88_006529 [Pleurodeles waltl]|uniref:Uncharacterized protein n=1 Tax=Pleurodeles waltl TaxID=8319 RepID=A0AAV7PRL3_PLEWA|nr:hypothetical protein NDU88_006529 [Pleurodeles waltl]
MEVCTPPPPGEKRQAGKPIKYGATRWESEGRTKRGGPQHTWKYRNTREGDQSEAHWCSMQQVLEFVADVSRQHEEKKGEGNTHVE